MDYQIDCIPPDFASINNKGFTLGETLTFVELNIIQSIKTLKGLDISTMNNAHCYDIASFQDLNQNSKY